MAFDINHQQLEDRTNDRFDDRIDDTYWMQHAINLAKEAESKGEVPVGAVLVQDNQILGQGFNQCILNHDPTAHAEIIAFKNAGIHTQNYRLLNTTLYVTLEPCLMCVGAMVHARIQRLVFGAFDPKTGAVGSVFHPLQDARLNHSIQTEGGLMAESCGELLRNFFRERR